MTDVFSRRKRSWIMGRIRSGNTSPEKAVRHLLHGLGFRFRLHYATLPGKPDIVLPRYRTAIFVNGCFWHQHSCKDGHPPGSNRGYWEVKLARNVKRDAANRAKLHRLGWRTLVLWECQVSHSEVVERKLLKSLKTGTHAA
jgi:DNA mismatch endonuclease (patch repair protein)